MAHPPRRPIVRMTFEEALPGIIVETCAGIVGFLLGLGWWRITGRSVNRKFVIIWASIVGAIMFAGIIFLFIL